jgi:hypothetical protein
MSNEKPKFPITLTWQEDGEQESFKNETDAGCTLEWLDTRDADAGVAVVDAEGRPVTLVVEKTEVTICHLV